MIITAIDPTKARERGAGRITTVISRCATQRYHIEIRGGGVICLTDGNTAARLAHYGCTDNKMKN